jgi:hypothetical protein
LGGQEISAAEFDFLFQTLEAPAAGADSALPVLLMTGAEWNQVQQALDIAGKSQEVAT